MSASPPTLATEVRLIFAGADANAEPYLGEGWHGAEPSHRWTDGARSLVRLPPLHAQPWFALTLNCGVYRPPGVAQTLTARLNGVELIRYAPCVFEPYAIVVPGELVRADAENILELDHPNAAAPSAFDPASGDGRTLAFSFASIALAPLDAPPPLTPRLLAPAAPPPADEAKAFVETFQSLGQNCDLGLVQRRHGAEPFGLLRFASIYPGQLVRGLERRFAGIDDAEVLRFVAATHSSELHGHHPVYGLAYHTFKQANETDVADLAEKEARRLGYLARLLCEQLDNNEKIFVRFDNFHATGEALAFHRLLQNFHPGVRLVLLQVTPRHAPERLGRMFELRPGLYRGYLSRSSNLGATQDPLLYEEWICLLASVVADLGLRPGS